ncbi:MAG: hypothetical protein C5B47_04170 [Verrucomicrobia bacterium]|nr:MAG: hypothetical protein C5B47_04170 [Verrucomicrobiota bacterium]
MLGGPCAAVAPKATKKQTHHVFLDTNTYLNFFLFSPDDIDELKKLKGFIDDGELVLYLPEQVIHEFERNREQKIRHGLDEFTRSILKPVPLMLRHFETAKDYEKAKGDFEKARSKLLDAAHHSAKLKALPADEIFAELKTLAKVAATTPAVYARALQRMRLGNPPGKPDSLGDRVIWESLLVSVPPENDLHVVTADTDFVSPLDDAEPREFLANEWYEKRRSTLRVHSKIKVFLKAKFDLEFETFKAEKQAAINALAFSGSFASTHTAIGELQPYVEYLEPNEYLEIAQAALNNNQIFWIGSDSDVAEFYKLILPKVPAGTMTADEMATLKKIFNPVPSVDIIGLLD